MKYQFAAFTRGVIRVLCETDYLRRNFPALTELEARLDCRWQSIRRAISASEKKRRHLERTLFVERERFLAPAAGFVCFGSLARAEWTCQSDLDWILLVCDGTEEQHAPALQTLSDRLDKAKELGPLPGGMFASTFSVPKLAASIKWPFSMTKFSVRLLILLESVAVGDDTARTKAIRDILAAYLSHPDPGLIRREDMADALLGDITRFGMKMAVDLGQKPDEQDGKEWGLRNAKRRFSRTLIILKGSLACARWRQNCESILANRPPALDQAITYFEKFLERPSLEVLASEVIHAGVPDSIARRVFDAYDQFLTILDDAESRRHLAELPRHLAHTSALFKRIQVIGHDFCCDLRNALNLPRLANV
jgi:hypothetical protein